MHFLHNTFFAVAGFWIILLIVLSIIFYISYNKKRKLLRFVFTYSFALLSISFIGVLSYYNQSNHKSTSLTQVIEPKNEPQEVNTQSLLEKTFSLFSDYLSEKILK